jgi:hypothetical protein
MRTPFLTRMQLELTDLLTELEMPQSVLKEEQLTLKLDEPPKFMMGSRLIANEHSNPCNMVFFDKEHKECGRFEWNDGVFKFKGNAHASVEAFTTAFQISARGAKLKASYAT